MIILVAWKTQNPKKIEYKSTWFTKKLSKKEYERNKIVYNNVHRNYISCNVAIENKIYAQDDERQIHLDRSNILVYS